MAAKGGDVKSAGGRPVVLVVDPLDADALARLRRMADVVNRLGPSRDELRTLVEGADALICRSGVTVDATVLSAASQLTLIVRAGAGLDNIDLDAARTAGILVRSVPALSAQSVAELAMGLVVTVVRRIVCADRQIRRGVWAKPQLVGTELRGATMGIVGVGEIGSRVATLARGFGMRVLGTVAHPTPQRCRAFAADGIELIELGELLAWSDVVCLTVPLTSATKGMIGAANLSRMRPGAYLVNVSRGGVVDEEALLRALKSGRVAGAALDVMSAESGPTALAEVEAVVLSPHIGAMTEQAQRRIGLAVVEAVMQHFALTDAPGEETQC